METLQRYSRQIRFGPIGPEGQAQIREARVLLCGCGALGSLIAERLTRAGVGFLRIVDRDWVELSNLQRQTLFTEQDAVEGVPKAVAASTALQKINQDVAIEAVVEDVTHSNVRELATDCNLILDGLDNFETRFLINDFSVANKVPWVHGGCLGASGQCLTVRPGVSACFRCLIPELPAREGLDNCDTAGVLGSAIGMVASWQTGEALKLLSGNGDATCPDLFAFDAWNNEVRIIGLPKSPICPTCNGNDYPFLEGQIKTTSTVLCGKNAVQLESTNVAGPVDLSKLATHVESLGNVSNNGYLLRLSLSEYVITVFRSGRIVVEGTTDVAEAKSIVARTLGT